MTSLYLDRLPEQDRDFKKTAAFASRLSEQAENWPQELTSELHKQLPFLSDYDVNVNLDRVEPQRGFAFGYADVASKTERPEVEHQDTGIPHIRIPLVVIERAVKPFSVFLDGELVLPLTEHRVREILFNPATFDLSTSQPRDPSLVEPLMPPQRTGMGGGEIKTASAKPSLLLAIAATIGERDVEAFVEKVANDATLRAGLRRSGIADTLVEAFDLTKRASAGERLEALASRIEPTCITFQKLPGGDFLVKTANKNAFQQGPDAKGQVVPQEEVAQAMGPANAQAMKPGQTATVSAEPAQGAAPPAENKSKIIDEFCQCRVQDMMGNSLIGHCFPQSLAWDGNFTPSPMAIFTNGSVYAVQDTVAGEIIGKATKLPVDAPRGDGIFYSTEGGEAVCTAPVTIGSSAAGPDGLPVLMGTDAFGTQLQISLAEGLKSPQRISDVEYALPASWKFMRLNNQTQLVPDPTQMNKQASARAEGGSVTLFYNGGFHLTGGCGLEKLSSDYRHDLDPVSAEFMLGVLGVDGLTAKQKVAEARKKGNVKLAGLHTITTLAERYAGSTKVASALMSKIPNLRRDLTKEAASIEDQGTVDSVLALNFINPENLATFVSYVPELEMSGERLAEMLLSSYLGMQELPEGAIERAMKNLEEVVQGLKNIEHSMGGEDQPV